MQPFNVIQAFAHAPTNLTFGQLLRGDAVHPRNQLRRVLAKPRRQKMAMAAAPTKIPRKHQLLPVTIYGHRARALLDTGAVPNLMSAQFAERLGVHVERSRQSIRVANGDVVDRVGVVKKVPVIFDDLVVPLNFLVLENAMYEVLLGMYSLTALKARFDLVKQEFTLEYDGNIVTIPLEYAAPYENPASDVSEEFTEYDSDPGTETENYVGAIDEVPRTPRDRVTVTVDLPTDGGPINEPDERTVRPLATSSDATPGVGSSVADLVNAVSWPSEVACTADPAYLADTEPDTTLTTFADETVIPHSLLEKIKHLTPNHQTRVLNAIAPHDVVAQSWEDLRPSQVSTVHHFTLDNYDPICMRPRRLHPDMNALVRNELDKMLEAGVIAPCSSPWAFPILLVDKPDGSNRLCVKFRRLNERMPKDSYPLPNIDELLDSLGGAYVFTKLDLFSGYWQVRLSRECQKYACFICKFGTFCFLVTPFGLQNAPSTFQRMMHEVFHDFDFVIVYMDDVVVFSKNYQDHFVHLERVFRRLADKGLRIKISKCELVQPEVHLLGHVVTPAGIRTDPVKIEAIQRYPIPTTTTDVRRFLGMTSYYRRFVRGFANIARPLYNLTSPRRHFEWQPEHNAAFLFLQKQLCEPPVLAYPDYDRPFIVSTDASDTALGAVLEQDDAEGRRHPIAYASQVLARPEQNYSTTDKEALAVVYALKKYRHYLLPRPFIVYSDHQALRGLFNRQDLTGRWARWVMLISEYPMEIRYRPGTRNQIPDALSRLPEASTPLPPSTLDELVAAIEATDHDDTMAFHIAYFLRTLAFAPTDSDPAKTRRKSRGYCLIDNRLYKRTPLGPKLWIPAPQRPQLLRCMHDENGHYDTDATYLLLRGRVWWPRLYQSVRDYVSRCLSCRRRRPLGPDRPPAPLCAPISGLWHTISIDFAGPLPRTPRQNRFILVAVEHVTRWPVARAFPNALSSVVTTFLEENIIQPYEIPRMILSDNGPQFISQHTLSFARAQGIRWSTTSPYNPRGNGRVERMVRTLKDSLAKLVEDHVHNWDLHLATAVRGYRIRPTREHPSPYFMLFGTAPRVLPSDAAAPNIVVPDLRAIETAQAATHRQREHRAGTSAPPPRFQVGDRVLLARTADRNRHDRKLNLKWDGPFTVSAREPPLYTLADQDGRRLRAPVNESRLQLYAPAPRDGAR